MNDLENYNNLFLYGEDVINHVAEENPEAIVLDPRKTFNCGIIGYDSDWRIIYSYEKLIDALVNINGMSAEDARDYFCYNTLGTFDGMDNPNKPIFMYEQENA